jgi:protein associated with RNAse G/E
MNAPRLYRRRYIPDELVELKDDEIIRIDDEEGIIITRWKPIKPRADFAAGVSCVFLRRGFKVSALYDENGEFLHYYCDILSCSYERAADTYVFRDLLIDVIVEADGGCKILDLDELCQAYVNRQINEKDMLFAVSALSGLLTEIYAGRFAALAAYAADEAGHV